MKERRLAEDYETDTLASGLTTSNSTHCPVDTLSIVKNRKITREQQKYEPNLQ